MGKESATEYLWRKWEMSQIVAPVNWRKLVLIIGALDIFFPFPFSFSLSRFTCIESGKLRNAVNRKMTKQFSLALIMNENKLGRQVCVYILLICAGCVIIRWPRWVEHTISNRLLRAERMSPAYTAIAADIEQTIFAGACKLLESLHVTKTCHLFTNISDLKDYVYTNTNVYWKMILSET